jgi:hypothetical protein
MSRLRTPANVVAFALKMRTEGMGIRASGRVLEKSHTSIMRWEQKLVNQSQQWSPPAPAGSDLTVEGDEVYTRVGENLPPSESKGWTVTFIERRSRYWIGCDLNIIQLLGSNRKPILIEIVPELLPTSRS